MLINIVDGTNVLWASKEGYYDCMVFLGNYCTRTRHRLVAWGFQANGKHGHTRRRNCGRRVVKTHNRQPQRTVKHLPGFG